jgi:protein transport protein HofB
MLDAISSAHPLSSYAVQLIDHLLQQAISLQASDIHFEPGQHVLRIRMRVDGLLQDIHRDQLIRANAVLVRLKLLSNMDITEQRRPQDGYFNHSLGDSSIDIRASCLPGHWGEKVVLRLQHPEIKQRTIHQLGLDIQQSQCLINYLQQPQGLMLITGPTGSGKSVTLYSILMHLHQPHRNLVSAEDTVEMGLDGVHQTAVNLHIDLDFSHILRSMLR